MALGGGPTGGIPQSPNTRIDALTDHVLRLEAKVYQLEADAMMNKTRLIGAERKINELEESLAERKRPSGLPELFAGLPGNGA